MAGDVWTLCRVGLGFSALSAVINGLVLMIFDRRVLIYTELLDLLC